MPYAASAGVRLAIEPLHPMFCSDRCVVSTLAEALDLAERFEPAEVGVVVDVYHVWWDAAVYRQIERAGARISSYQVCDWVLPLPEDVLLGRGMIGDGVIELRRLREACDAAGYTGPIEVEIFNADLWAAPGQQVLRHRAAALPDTSPDADRPPAVPPPRRWWSTAGAWLGIGTSPGALVLGAGVADQARGAIPLLGACCSADC